MWRAKSRACSTRVLSSLRGTIGLFLAVLGGLLPSVASGQGALPVQWLYRPIYPVYAVAYSPDGTMLAVGGNGGIQVFSVSQGTLQACLQTNASAVNSIAFSPNGKTLAVGGYCASTVSGAVEMWNVASWTPAQTIDSGASWVNSVAFSPDGTKLAVAGYATSGLVQIWNTATYKQILSLKTTATVVNSACFSPDGSTLADGGQSYNLSSSTFNGVLEMWSVSSGGLTASLATGANYNVNSTAFSPNGLTLADGGESFSASKGAYSGAVELWNVSTKKLSATLATQASDGVKTVAFSPSGLALADGGEAEGTSGGPNAGTLEIWTLASPTSSQSLDTSAVDVYSVAYSPDGKTLASGGQNPKSDKGFSVGELELWNAAGGNLLTSLDTTLFDAVDAAAFSNAGTGAVAFSPDGGSIAVGGFTYGKPVGSLAGALSIWGSGNGRPILSLDSAAANGVNTVAFDPAGPTLADGGSYTSATKGQTGVLELWNSSSGASISSLPTGAAQVNSLSFSQSGALLADGGTNQNATAGVLELWNASKPTTSDLFPTEAGDVLSVALSPDGSMLADGGYSGSSGRGGLELWNVSSGKVTQLPTSASPVTSVAFSPNGQIVAAGGASADTPVLQLWSAPSGELLASVTLAYGTTNVNCVSFSPDGTLVCVATNMGLQFVSAATYELVEYYPGSNLLSVAFSASGAQVAYAGIGVGNKSGFGGFGLSANPLLSQVSISSFSVSPASLEGGATATGTVTLLHPAPAGGGTVNLSSSTQSASLPANITVAGGAASATFTISTVGVNTPTTATITATTVSGSKSATLTIAPAAMTSLTLSAPSVVSGGAVVGTVTLNGPAGPLTVVSLSCVSSAVSIPASVAITAGFKSATFTVTANSVKSSANVTITAAWNGQSQAAGLSVSPLSLQGVGVNPSTVVGGKSPTGTVSLNGNAGSGGIAVSLSSSNTAVTVPKSISVAPGQSSATFTVGTSAVGATKTATINANSGTAMVTTTLTVTPPTAVAVTLDPVTVTGGVSATGTVAISSAAPKGGVVVQLSSNAKSATVPGSVTVASGKTFATFTVKSIVVGSKTTAAITATSGGVSKSAVLTITPPVLKAVSLNPASVAGGKSSTGTVSVGSAAPTGGLSISLSSSSSAATLPATVTISAGKTSATFAVKTSKVSAKTSVTVGASLGTSSKSATLSIT